MTYHFTEAEVAAIESAASGSGSRPFSDAYALIADILETPDANGNVAPLAVRAWFIGARDVNRGTGAFSDFIRGYTESQIAIRLGTSVGSSNELLDRASDAIGAAVINDIVSSGDTLPSLNRIGSIDAGRTLAQIAADTGLPADTAIWSGNLLFVGLGDSSFFRNALLRDGRPYDMLAAAKAALDNGLDVLGSYRLGEIFDTGDPNDDAVLRGALQLGAAGSAALAARTYLLAEYGGTLDLDDLAFDEILLGRVGATAETLTGTSNDEIFHGNDGNDTIISGGGDDIIDGGRGGDTADFSRNPGGLLTITDPDEVSARNVGNYGGNGGGVGSRAFLYDIENVVLGNGREFIDVRSLARFQEIDAGAGDDRLTLEQLEGEGVTFDIETGAISNGSGSAVIKGIAEVFGTAHDDTISGGAGEDTINGGGGDDELAGGGANDFLDGGGGSDIAFFSGNGLDYDVKRNGDGTITVTHARGSATDGVDTLRNIETARFGNGQELDLTVAELGGFTRIFVPSTLVEGSGNLLVQTWSREGDTGYAFDLFQDGEVIRSDRLSGFVDAPRTWSMSSTSLDFGVRVLDGSAFENDELLRVLYSLEESDGLQQSVIFDVNGAETMGPFSIDFLATGDDGTDEDGGAAFGDPHLITLDNVFYDFMASGEFILSRATEGPEFQVQARFVSISSVVSVTDAVATTIDGVEVNVQRGPSGSSILRVNGAVVSLIDGERIDVGSGGSVTRSGRELTIENSNGDLVEVSSFGSFTGFLNVAVVPADNRTPGTLEGLLGNDNGIAGDDFQLANGTILTTPLPTDILYGAFAESWVVSAQDSILPGSREDFSAPERILTIESLPPALRARAEQAVDDAGITNPILREAAILDFALIGDEAFIEAVREADEQFDPIVDIVPIDPVSNPAILLTSDSLVLDEETNGAATLTVSRGDTEGDLVVNYSITGVGAAPASADDFANSTVSGSIVIADGDESASFVVETSDDTEDEGLETFKVSIDLEAESETFYEILASDVQLSIQDDDRVSSEPTRIKGTSNDDANLRGSIADEIIVGRAGDDIIFGLGGEDRVFGGADNDSIDGGAGSDLLIGNDGNDTLLGAAGDDQLRGKNGADSLDGGVGNDTLWGDLGEDVFLFGEGDDVLRGDRGKNGPQDADLFILDTLNNGTDRILDFSSTDRIDLQGADFSFDVSSHGKTATVDIIGGGVIEIRASTGVDLSVLGDEIFV